MIDPDLSRREYFACEIAKVILRTYNLKPELGQENYAIIARSAVLMAKALANALDEDLK